MTWSERSSNTTKIETMILREEQRSSLGSERSSNTTKIETPVQSVLRLRWLRQKEVLTQQRLKLILILTEMKNQVVRKKF